MASEYRFERGSYSSMPSRVTRHKGPILASIALVAACESPQLSGSRARDVRALAEAAAPALAPPSAAPPEAPPLPDDAARPIPPPAAGSSRDENRTWCLQEAAKPGPNEPCELPRDVAGRPIARPDQTVACGHLMTPVCQETEFCTRADLGMTHAWRHEARGNPGGRASCYTIPPVCKGDRVCACLEETFRDRIRCGHGYFLACSRDNEPGGQDPGDLVLDCEGIR
jgi:hypothetical protein